MSIRTQLIAARALVEKGWTKFHMAADGAGLAVPVKDESATRFCALGACARVTNHSLGASEELASEYEELRSQLVPFLPSAPSSYMHPVATFNDAPGTTQADVLAVYDAAIEACHE